VIERLLTWVRVRVRVRVRVGFAPRLRGLERHHGMHARAAVGPLQGRAVHERLHLKSVKEIGGLK
jgi:hypothetical protein